MTLIQSEPKKITMYQPSRLPSTYQEVEYIETTGAQYINTGYVPQSGDTATIKFNMLTCTGDEQRIFAVWENPYGYRAGVEQYGTSWNTSSGFSYDVTGLDTDITATGNCSRNFTKECYLFAQNENGTPYHLYKGTMKLYSCIIYRNGDAIRDFVPCYRKLDSVIGLYDLANGVFYTNAGSGTFTKGNNTGGSSVDIKKIMMRPGGVEKQIRPAIVERPDINTYTQTSNKSTGHTNIHGICVSDNGNYIYMAQANSNNIYEHYISDGTLNTYSSTATASKSGTDQRGMFYKDPKQLYAIRESYSSIYNISMSTDYDLSTATITTPSIAITDTKKSGCEFSPDGVYFYRSYWDTSNVMQYTLSTPWNLSTATLTYTLDTSSYFNRNPYDIRFSPTGKKVWIGTRTASNPGIYQFTCSTPYMLNTATYDNKYLRPSFPLTFDVTESGRIFLVNMDNEYIYQYDAS